MAGRSTDLSLKALPNLAPAGTAARSDGVRDRYPAESVRGLRKPLGRIINISDWSNKQWNVHSRISQSIMKCLVKVDQSYFCLAGV
jgi:hypothetical protein